MEKQSIMKLMLMYEKLLYRHSIILIRTILSVLMVCGLTISCATTKTPDSIPASNVGQIKTKKPDPIPAQDQIHEATKKHDFEFDFKIIADNTGTCPDLDKKRIHILGRDTRFKMILTFPHPLPTGVEPKHFSAHIGQSIINFSHHPSIQEFHTDIIEAGLLTVEEAFKQTGISIYYKNKMNEIFLGEKGVLRLDKIPPKKPINLSITDYGPQSFRITWELEGESKGKDIKEYRIEGWAKGNWTPVISGIQATSATIQSPPEGLIRVAAIDCALNKTVSDELLVSTIKIKKRACGSSKESANRAVRSRINDAYMQTHVGYWLKSNTQFTNREIHAIVSSKSGKWLPPLITYKEKHETNYSEEQNLWCADVAGLMDRNRFMGWISRKCDLIQKQRKRWIKLTAVGPGSEILAGAFRSKAVAQNYRVFSENDNTLVDPAHYLTIKVSLGDPYPLNMADLALKCWHVQASLTFNKKNAGRNFHLILRDIDSIDARIYGRDLREALTGPGPNAFPERIGRPFLKEFLQGINL